MKLALALSIAALALGMTGCANLKEKTVAADCTVYGMDLQVPNLNSSGSVASFKLGVIRTRFADAPKGGSVDMSSNHSTTSVWTGSGSGEANFKINGPSASTETDSTRQE